MRDSIGSMIRICVLEAYTGLTLSVLRVGQSPKLAYAGAEAVGLQQATYIFKPSHQVASCQNHCTRMIHACARDDLQLPRPMGSKYTDVGPREKMFEYHFLSDQKPVSAS
jgi:hypothetical protein